MNVFKSLIKTQSFQPSFWAVFFLPTFIIRKGLFKGVKSFSHLLKGRLLDVGCGSKPYQNLFLNVTEYIGMDIEVSGNDKDNKKYIDVYYDGKTIPFDSNSFDSVISSEVFEHVFNLEDILKEINRVLKPGGNALFTLPFVWEEHEKPYDFARYTKFGILHLLQKAGFKIVEYQKSTNDFETIFQVFVHRFLLLQPFRNKILVRILYLILFSVPSIFVYLLSRLQKSEPDFYHNHIILVKKS